MTTIITDTGVVALMNALEQAFSGALESDLFEPNKPLPHIMLRQLIHETTGHTDERLEALAQAQIAKHGMTDKLLLTWSERSLHKRFKAEVRAKTIHSYILDNGHITEGYIPNWDVYVKPIEPIKFISLQGVITKAGASFEEMINDHAGTTHTGHGGSTGGRSEDHL